MHSPVIQVGRDARFHKAVHSVHLLLIGNQMLDRCNDPDALDALDCQSTAKCLEDRV